MSPEELARELEVAAAGPRSAWTLGRYRFARYSRQQKPGRRWEASNTRMGRGVSNHRTPVGAFLALRRWEKMPAEPT